MSTLLNEILQETESLDFSQNKKECSCSNCNAVRNRTLMKEAELIQHELGKNYSGLSMEEELEFGKAFARLKDLAKKGLRKVNHPLFSLLLRILPPVVSPPRQLPPAHQTLDYARFAEEEKRRKREADLAAAIRNQNPKIIGKP